MPIYLTFSYDRIFPSCVNQIYCFCSGEPRRTHGNEDDDDYEDSPVPPPPKKKKKLKPPTSISASGMPGGK